MPPQLSALTVAEYVLWEDPRGEMPDVRLCRVRQRSGPPLWAIRIEGSSLRKDGSFAHEPPPSNRDDEFTANYRFAIPEDAIAVWWGKTQPVVDPAVVAERKRIADLIRKHGNVPVVSSANGKLYSLADQIEAGTI
jgi:hypothetical protein